MTSCNDDDNSIYSDWENVINNRGSNFDFDAQGRCYGLGSIAEADFNKHIVGHGWKHYGTWKISEDGKRLPKEYYKDMLGASPLQYYFGEDHTVTTYYVSNAEAWAKKSDTVPYTFYQTDDHVLDSSLMCSNDSYIQIIGWSINTLCVVKPLAVTGYGEKIFGVSIYEKMSDEELATYQNTYNE